MKGERTLNDKPFRFGGIEHNFDLTSADWNERGVNIKRCWCCGGDMQIRSSGPYRQYPYVAVFKITKGRYKGMSRFRPLCRKCAYDYERGVIEMDGKTYRYYHDFSEDSYKDKIKYRYEGI